MDSQGADLESEERQSLAAPVKIAGKTHKVDGAENDLGDVLVADADTLEDGGTIVEDWSERESARSSEGQRGKKKPHSNWHR